ncbi:MAG: hypothetical protein U1F09_00825 [Steroidobacteraceae bacterium]
MNVSLQGARSEARLDWDRLEESRKASQALSARVFLAALLVFAGYMVWKHFTG